MRIITRAVYRMTDDGFELLEQEGYDYDGPVALAKKDDEQTTTSTIDVPAFLQPFIRQGASTGSGALRSLQQLLGGNLVAGFNPTQQSAFDLATQRALGGGGFLPQAQQTFMQAAQGQGLGFLPDATRQALSGFGGLDFLPQFTRDTLTAGGGVPTTATDALGNLIQGEVIPGGLSSFGRATTPNVSVSPTVRDTLSSLASGVPLDVEGLRRTAGGDFLFGGPGSEAAIQAAVRAAQPAILSTFGSAGVGGGTGALSQAAIGQAATDAFARQFGQERQNQLAAQDTLARLGLAQGDQRAQAAQALGGLDLEQAQLAGNLGLAGRGQDIGIAQALADAGLSQRAQQLQAAGLLGDLGLSSRGQDIQSAGLFGGFAEGAQGRALNAAGIQAQLADAERARQLTAAGALPDLAFAGLDQLLGIGGMQQQLAQQQISAPIAAQQQLLAATLGIPGAFSPLFGQTQTTRTQSDPLGQILGGALTAASLFGTGGLGGLGGLFGGGSLLGGSSFAPMTTGGLLSTSNPLEFFTAPIGAFGP